MNAATMRPRPASAGAVAYMPYASYAPAYSPYYYPYMAAPAYVSPAPMVYRWY
jgi:hypothetical protein